MSSEKKQPNNQETELPTLSDLLELLEELKKEKPLKFNSLKNRLVELGMDANKEEIEWKREPDLEKLIEVIREILDDSYQKKNEKEINEYSEPYDFRKSHLQNSMGRTEKSKPAEGTLGFFRKDSNQKHNDEIYGTDSWIQFDLDQNNSDCVLVIASASAFVEQKTGSGYQVGINASASGGGLNVGYNSTNGFTPLVSLNSPTSEIELDSNRKSGVIGLPQNQKQSWVKYFKKETLSNNHFYKYWNGDKELIQRSVCVTIPPFPTTKPDLIFADKESILSWIGGNGPVQFLFDNPFYRETPEDIDKCFVIGNCRELGNWIPESAKPLALIPNPSNSSNTNFFQASILIPKRRIEYKFIWKRGNNLIWDPEGEGNNLIFEP